MIEVDKELGSALIEFGSIVNKRDEIMSDASLSPGDKKSKIVNLTYKVRWTAVDFTSD